ncbi:MAG: L-2-hydroxyglutarate oxidase [Planctomycetota bacterium]
MSETFDVLVVGAGLVGLGTARALLRGGGSLAVVEAEDRVAAHQSGNNSGVLHAGLYYRPGSEKARLCARGREQMVAFCDEHGVRWQRTGKLVVATRPEQVSALDELQRRGAANGLGGIERLGPDGLRSHEPHVRGVEGLWVPATGIVDFKAVAAALQGEIERAGGSVSLRAPVTAVRRDGDAFVVRVGPRDVRARFLVNCAGLQADRVARLCGVQPPARIVPFRGEYKELRPQARDLVRGLIYPVPDPRFPFLGVHFTRRVDGSVEAGPNAVLALSRHGYRWRDVSVRDLCGYVANGGFWRMARRYWRTGFAEVGRSLSHGAFTRALQELVPEVAADDLLPGGSGVRAQALRRDGTLADDFVFGEGPGSLHVLSAPSPAATACLAIGEEIAAKVAASGKP